MYSEFPLWNDIFISLHVSYHIFSHSFAEPTNLKIIMSYQILIIIQLFRFIVCITFAFQQCLCYVSGVIWDSWRAKLLLLLLLVYYSINTIFLTSYSLTLHCFDDFYGFVEEGKRKEWVKEANSHWQMHKHT